MMSNWFKPEIANKFLIKTAIPVSASEKSISAIFEDVKELHMVKLISIDQKAVLMGITPDQKRSYRDAITGIAILIDTYQSIE